MLWPKLVGVLAAVSISVAVSAQAPPSKPKNVPKKRPAAAKPAPTPVEPEPVQAPAPPPPPATDVQFRTTYVTGAQVSQNTTSIQGARQRFEFPGITMITQCDLKRSVQVHDGTKRYMLVASEAPPAGPAAPPEPGAGDAAAQHAAMSMAGGNAAPAKPKGGVITQTIAVTDTGERQQMFGREARRVKTSVVRQPDEHACEQTVTTVETDGWYVDLPAQASCPSLAAPAQAPPAAGQQTCTDRVVTRQTGESALGFAVTTMMTTTAADAGDNDKPGEVTTMSMEVTDLQVTSLDKALFEIPEGYTEVSDYASLLPSLAQGGSLADAVFGSIADGTSTVAPKKSGIIRVGIVTPANKTGKELPDLRLVGGLLGGFTKVPFEGLPIEGATTEDRDRDAAAKACDYILVTDITEIKTSKPNKVGGLLKKVSGDMSGPTEIHEARVEYKLFAVGDPAKPTMTSSVKASSGGGFGIGSALRLAAFAGQMYLTMGMGSGMMGMMPGGGFGGGLGGGLLTGAMNPGLGAAMSIMSAGAGMPGGAPGMGDASEGKLVATVQDGLSKAARQVVDELRKGKAKARADRK